jgi:hypothetical protein
VYRPILVLPKFIISESIYSLLLLLLLVVVVVVSGDRVIGFIR